MGFEVIKKAGDTRAQAEMLGLLVFRTFYTYSYEEGGLFPSNKIAQW